MALKSPEDVTFGRWYIGSDSDPGRVRIIDIQKNTLDITKIEGLEDLIKSLQYLITYGDDDSKTFVYEKNDESLGVSGKMTAVWYSASTLIFHLEKAKGALLPHFYEAES